MDKRELFDKLNQMWDDDKSRKFLSHLVRNFLPVNKAKYVVFGEDNTEDLKCCLSGEKVHTKADMTGFLLKHSDQLTNHMLDSMKAMAKGEPEPPHPLAEYKGTFNLAIRCDGSDKIMSEQVYLNFVDWVLTKMLTDNHMSWIARDMRNKNTADHLGKYASNDTENKVVRKVEKHARSKSGLTLGDMDVLKQLSEKMKSEESK